jgi:transposase
MLRSKHEAATVAATDGEAMPRIEIVEERRRADDAAFRAMVVSESIAAGARVQDVAARHGICPSLVYRWRRIAEVGTSGGSAVHLFPVWIAAVADETVSSQSASPPNAGTPRRSGLIEIELSNGVRVSVDEGVSVTALRRVMSVLRGC